MHEVVGFIFAFIYNFGINIAVAKKQLRLSAALITAVAARFLVSINIL